MPWIDARRIYPRLASRPAAQATRSFRRLRHRSSLFNRFRLQFLGQRFDLLQRGLEMPDDRSGDVLRLG